MKPTNINHLTAKQNAFLSIIVCVEKIHDYVFFSYNIRFKNISRDSFKRNYRRFLQNKMSRGERKKNSQQTIPVDSIRKKNLFEEVANIYVTVP